MPTLVVPFRAAGKTRLGPGAQAIAADMLERVVDACRTVGPTIVVTDEPAAVPEGACAVADPGGGQGAAVEAALATLEEWPAAVVNADVPLATPGDVEQLLEAAVETGLALVAAADGTTNALALARPGLFRPLYGPGSAERFRALGAVDVDLPHLAADIDTPADLERLAQAAQ